MAAMCLLSAAMVWYDEPIKLCTHSPTNTHLRAFVAERGAHPTSAQTLTPGREGVSQSPPCDAHPEERPLSSF